MEHLLLIKLKPRAPFHLGERGIGLEETSEIVRSDTLFGALCWCWTLLTGRDPNEFLEPFVEGKPPVVLSSAFPYWNEVLLLPRPLTRLPIEGDEEFQRNAEKASFVSLKLLEALSQRKVPQAELGLLEDKRLLVTHSEAEKLKASNQKPWTMERVPRVALDRKTSASEIFHTGRVVFSEGCGLYLLVRILEPNSAVTQKLKALFRLLGDEGLGGERSCGYGFFEPEFSELEINFAPGPRTLLLSLYNPKDAQELEAFDLTQSAYQLVRRRSWVFSPRAKDLQTDAVHYFAEGSVLCGRKDLPVGGRLVKVLEPAGEIPHPVYRNGFGFFVGRQEGRSR